MTLLFPCFLMKQTSKVPNSPQIIKGVDTTSNLPLSDKEVVTPNRVPIVSLFTIPMTLNVRYNEFL